MNGYLILGVLFALAGLGSWGAWEDGQAAKAKADLESLKASYALAAQQAKDDAAKIEQQDRENMERLTKSAVDEARDSELQAQNQLADYQEKLKKAPGEKDLPHLCSAVVIPSDLLPGEK